MTSTTYDLHFADEEPKLRNLPQIWLQNHTLKYPALQPLEYVIKAQLLGTWATLSPLTAQYTCVLLGFSHLWNEEAELENPFTTTIRHQNNNSTYWTNQTWFCYLIQDNGDLSLKREIGLHMSSFWSIGWFGKRYSFPGILESYSAGCVPQFPLLIFELLEGKIEFIHFCIPGT